MSIYQMVTPMAIVFVGDISFISIVKGVYKLTNITGGHHLAQHMERYGAFPYMVVSLNHLRPSSGANSTS